MKKERQKNFYEEYTVPTSYLVGVPKDIIGFRKPNCVYFISRKYVRKFPMLFSRNFFVIPY